MPTVSVCGTLPQHAKEGNEDLDDRKRKYNSLAGQDTDVTQEEMEA